MNQLGRYYAMLSFETHGSAFPVRRSVGLRRCRRFRTVGDRGTKLKQRGVCVCVSFVDTDGDEMATLYDKFDKEIKRIGWKCLAT